MATSMAGTPITEENTRAALAACDPVPAQLGELFADAPRQPQYTEYDLVVDENGEYKWAQNDMDLLIRKAIATAAKELIHR